MFLRVLAIAIFSISPSLAQSGSPPKKQDSDLTVKFLAEQFPANLGKAYLVAGEKKSTSFALPTNRLGEPIAPPARTAELKLEGKDVSLCQVVLPEEGKSFAVVLVTAKPSGFKPIIVRTDDPAFKAGDVFFINTSEKTILGKLGQTALVLKPGETSKSRPSGAVENTYYDIAFAIREEAGDKLISSSRWPVDQDLRSYLFFFTNAQGRTTFRAVDEYLAAGKP